LHKVEKGFIQRIFFYKKKELRLQSHYPFKLRHFLKLLRICLFALLQNHYLTWPEDNFITFCILIRRLRKDQEQVLAKLDPVDFMDLSSLYKYALFGVFKDLLLKNVPPYLDLIRTHNFVPKEDPFLFVPRFS
jgi:hypothetical protein